MKREQELENTKQNFVLSKFDAELGTIRDQREHVVSDSFSNGGASLY